MAESRQWAPGPPPGDRAPRPHLDDDDRVLVIEAAARLFVRDGAGATSAADVATAAGVPVGAVLSRYPDAAALLADVVAARVDERVAEAAWLVEADATGRDDALAAMSRLLVAVAEKDGDTAVLQAELWRLALTDPATMAGLAARAREVDRAIAHVARVRFDRLDALPDVPAESLATVLSALFEGLLQRRRTDPGAVPDELFGLALRWIVDGVRAGRAARG